MGGEGRRKYERRRVENKRRKRQEDKIEQRLPYGVKQLI